MVSYQSQADYARDAISNLIKAFERSIVLLGYSFFLLRRVVAGANYRRGLRSLT